MRVTSPWMTAFYICSILLLPMLFMGMIPSARAQDAATEKVKNEVTGPGKHGALSTNKPVRESTSS